jgi:hypothetical protein
MWSWVRAALFLGGLVLSACDSGSPTSPTPTPTPGPATPLSLIISGTIPLNHPGDTAQLTAMATFSDNSRRDVTRDASWSASGAVAFLSPGLIQAVRYGDGSFTASYLSVSAGSGIRVLDPGAFLIEGLVSAAGTFFPGLAQATVESSSRSGTYATMTSDYGWYYLPASGETTIRVEKAGYVAQIRQITVEQNLSIDFELEPVAAVSARQR